MKRRPRVRKWKPPYYIYLVGGIRGGERIEVPRYLGGHLALPFMNANGRIWYERYDYHLFHDGTIVGVCKSKKKRK